MRKYTNRRLSNKRQHQEDQLTDPSEQHQHQEDQPTDPSEQHQHQGDQPIDLPKKSQQEQKDEPKLPLLCLPYKTFGRIDLKNIFERAPMRVIATTPTMNGQYVLYEGLCHTKVVEAYELKVADAAARSLQKNIANNENSASSEPSPGVSGYPFRAASKVVIGNGNREMKGTRALQTHQRLHNREFPCKLCAVSFSTKENLGKHVTEKHEMLLCDKCCFMTNNSTEYIAHHIDNHTTDDEDSTRPSPPPSPEY